VPRERGHRARSRQTSFPRRNLTRGRLRRRDSYHKICGLRSQALALQAQAQKPDAGHVVGAGNVGAVPFLAVLAFERELAREHVGQGNGAAVRLRCE
jgi:hypothetical protein